MTSSVKRYNPQDRLIDGQTHLISSNKINRRQVHMSRDKKTEDNLPPIAISDEDKEIFGVILEQMSLKKGMKEFGYERANESIMKEFQQLHDQNCWKPRDASNLSREVKRNTLSTVVFMKQKRDGRIKITKLRGRHTSEKLYRKRRMQRRQPSAWTTCSLLAPSTHMKAGMS